MKAFFYIITLMAICLGMAYLYEDYRNSIFNLQMDVYDMGSKIIELEDKITLMERNYG